MARKSKQDRVERFLVIFSIFFLSIQNFIHALDDNYNKTDSYFSNKNLSFLKKMNNIQYQSNCLEFNEFNPKQCLKCQKGYFLEIQSEYQCIKCQHGCNECISIDKCLDEQQVFEQKQERKQPKIIHFFTLMKERLLLVCQLGQFLQNGQCLTCSIPCSSCINQSTTCTDCIEGYYLQSNTCEKQCLSNQVIQGNVCQSNCNQGFYLNFSTNTCQQCPSSCVSCFNQYQCYNGCQPNFFFLDGQCIQTCPSRYFAVSGIFPQCQKCPQYCSACTSANVCSKYSSTQTCQPCPYNCSQCTSSDPATCTSCIAQLDSCLKPPQCQFPSGYYFDKDCKKVQCPSNCSRCDANGCIECNNSYFIAKSNNQYLCQNCHSSCLNCSGSLSDQCTSCTSQLYFYKNQCLSECPQGYYSNSQNICTLCPSSLNCSSCKTSTQCTTCKNGFYMSQAQNSQVQVCMPCDSACKLCNGPTSSDCLGCMAGQQACNNCAVGYFQDGQKCFKMSQSSICSSQTFPNYTKQYCQLCPDKCLTCNQQACTSCISSSFYLNIDGTCQKCSDAIQNCQTCLNQISCQTCQSGFRLDQGTGLCEPYCPPIDGYYQNPNDQSCTTCPQGCLKCSQEGSKQVQCSSCQDGYYYDPTTKVCLVCSSNCLLCEDGNSCAKCGPSYYLMPATNNSPSVCVNTCNAGYYQELESRLCVQCNIDNCTSCNGPTSCTVCLRGYFLDLIYKSCSQCSDNCLQCTNSQNCTLCDSGFILTQNGDGSITCVRSCLQNQYVSTDPSTCVNCNIKCQFCYSANRCMACTNNYYLSINSSDPNNSTCESCSSRCTLCFGPNSNQCYFCQKTYFLINNQCLTDSECKGLGGYFPDQVKQICSSCHPLCKSCVSNSSDKCLSCIDGYYLQSNSCVPCSSTCLTCSNSSTQCTSCFIGFFFNQSTNQCIKNTDSCPSTFYQDPITNTCKSCQSPCSTCTGPTIYECTGCVNGYYYNSKSIEKCIQCSSSCSICRTQIDDSTQQLVQVCDTCSNGYYKSESTQTQCKSCLQQQYSKNNQCFNCDSSCRTCNDSLITSCTSCPPKFYVLKQNQIDISGRCDNCFQGCLTCLSNAKNQCQSCVPGYYFYENQCYIACPYQLVPDSKSTCQCQIEGCSKCVIDQVKQVAVCISCQNSDFFLYNSSCLSVCPPNLYSNLITKQCVDKCSITDFQNENLKQCTDKCSLYSYTDIKNQKICTSKCPDGYYIDLINRQCQICDKNCQTCNGPTNNSCIICNFGNLIHQGTNICNPICLNGYIVSPDNTMCLICQNNCSFCIQSLVLYVNQCLTKCPFGFQVQSGTNRCIATSYQSVQILNADAFSNQGVSPFQDLEIEAVLINIDPGKIVSIEWKLISSTDQTIQQLFTGINSFVYKYNLILFISQKYLRGNQKHIFQLEVTLPNNISFNQIVTVFVKKEMMGGKFTVNQPYQDDKNAFNNFYSFSMGFFDTTRSYLIYRIQCEKIKIVNNIYLVSYQNLLLFDELTVNLMDISNEQKNLLIDDSFESSTDKYYFPVSNVDQNYICSLVIRGNSSSTDTAQEQQQQDFAILFQNLTIPAFSQEIQVLNQQIQTLVDYAEKNPSQIQYSQQVQLAYSLDHVINQIAIDQFTLLLAQNSLEIEINNQNNPLTIEQVNKIWSQFFQKCDQSIDQLGSITCICKDQYFGIFCQYDSQDYQAKLLQRVSNFLQNQIIKSIEEQVSATPPKTNMGIIPLIRKLLVYNLNINDSSMFFTTIIQYLTSILQTKMYDQILDFIQDIFIIMENLELNIMVSSFVSSTQRSQIINQLKNLKNLWGVYFSNNSYLSQSLTLECNFCKINLVTLQQIRANDKKVSQQQRQQTYLTVSYDSISISIPPEVVKDWNKLTIIQRVNTFIPQTKSDTYSVLLSPIYDIDLFSDESKQKIIYSNLQQPFLIQLALQAPLIINDTTKITSSLFECVYFDDNANQWSTQGISFVKIINNYYVLCQTYHLSRFAIRKANLTPNYSSEAVDKKQLFQILPHTEVKITTYVPTQPGQKSLSIQDWLKQDLIQSLNLQNANKNPYYIDSFLEVQNENIVILSHLQFLGITPFKYPDNFQTPFGLYFVLIWCSSVLVLFLLIKFQVTQIIRKMIQFIIQRIKKDEAQKKQKHEREQKKKEKEQKQEGKNDKNNPQNDIELGLNTIGKTEEDENNRDLALLNKIKKDMNLLYQSNNLDTPNNKMQNKTDNKNQELASFVDKYKLKKNKNEKEDFGFGQYVDKRMNSFNYNENPQMSNSGGVKKNPQLYEVQRSFQRRESVLSLYSNRSPKSNTMRANSLANQDAIIEKNIATEIWNEQDFVLKQNVIKIKNNQDNQNLDEDNQILLIKNPLNYFQWYNHHSLISILVKDSKLKANKMLTILQFNLIGLSIGASSVITNDLENIESYVITIFLAPVITQFFFSLYNFFFFQSSQSVKYTSLRGGSQYFAQAFDSRYQIGQIVISILIFLGDSILLILFGQKRYVKDYGPVIARFGICWVVDFLAVETVILLMSFIIFKLKKKISPFRYYLYFIMKGYAISFAEISDFYLKKSEKDQLEQRKIRNIVFDGDIQNKKRERISKKKAEKKNQNKEAAKKKKEHAKLEKKKTDLEKSQNLQN